MFRAGFRARLLAILALFAVIPATVVSVAAVATLNRIVPLIAGAAPWNAVAESGADAITAARAAPLTEAQREAIDVHERELAASVQNARQLQLIARNAAPVVALVALVALIVIVYITWRVAGHLSRQLSRPLDELVGWTDAIARGAPLPSGEDGRGAPEFGVLRDRMRSMATQLEAGRARAMEAERLRAYRESSRRFAHELKNPLTPIRFALARLRRGTPDNMVDAVEVIATETERLESMARSFSQFGRLPEGPVAEIDIAEFVAYAGRAAVPDSMTITVDIEPGVPAVRGHYEALGRALSNIVRNAVEACEARGALTVRARSAELRGAPAVTVSVTDSGPGIPPEKLEGIWAPYVTGKAGGTGLGLAIVRQTVEAHGGEVFATSRPGETTIGFTIPVNAGLPAITGEWNAG